MTKKRDMEELWWEAAESQVTALHTARDLLARAKTEEPTITPSVLHAAAMSGGVLKHLDHRLKREPAAFRKVRP
jgi:hypothetical protein